ncbi:MAG: M14-type cytosolic carboxypeptidase [Armatimonadota bacterium]
MKQRSKWVDHAALGWRRWRLAAAASLPLLLIAGATAGGEARTPLTDRRPPSAPAGPALPAITFNTSFEGASLGKVEKLGETRFRCSVEGQYDERGRNRQATWYYFRMDRVRGRHLTLTLTDLVGEYNDRPGAVPMSADTIPVYSEDGLTWRHFPQMEWDDRAKEATLRFRPAADTIWIAHVPPYTHSDLLRLLREIDRSPAARIEVIGKTVQGRDLHLVTVTDFHVPDAGKRTVWLQARQHAWEAGTSYVLEGALRFLTSEDERARELRRKLVFRFLPMGDPDGSARGKVRFNANGYDVNRHWDEVDLRAKDLLASMPEIWYTKKLLLAEVDAGRAIDLMVNMHNTETAEYVDTLADDPASRALVERFQQSLVNRSSFDPSRPPTFGTGRGTTNSLYQEKRIPVLLMELRIGTSAKLGRRPSVDDRLRFGRDLVVSMAEAVLR